MKKMAGLVTAVLLLVQVAGCNTMEGFGKDLEKLGEEIQEGIQKNKN